MIRRPFARHENGVGRILLRFHNKTSGTAAPLASQLTFARVQLGTDCAVAIHDVGGSSGRRRRFDTLGCRGFLGDRVGLRPCDRIRRAADRTPLRRRSMNSRAETAIVRLFETKRRVAAQLANLNDDDGRMRTESSRRGS